MRLDAFRMGRKRWSVKEKQRIVELTLVPGPSVARIAQAEGVNANQMFLWRRAYRNGELQPGDSAALVPVVIEAEFSDGADLTSDLGVHRPPPSNRSRRRRQARSTSSLGAQPSALSAARRYAAWLSWAERAGAESASSWIVYPKPSRSFAMCGRSTPASTASESLKLPHLRGRSSVD